MRTLQLVLDGALMTGDDVAALQRALADRGFPPGKIDGIFGVGTDAAVRAFQQSEGDLLIDGLAGPRTQARLGLTPDASLPAVSGNITTAIAARMLPGARLTDIEANLPPLVAGLTHFGLTDKQMVLMALGTIAAETAGFKPIDEYVSRYNTSPRGHPFDLYDNRRPASGCCSPNCTSTPRCTSTRTTTPTAPSTAKK